jgi:hypothetical protein
VNQVRDFFELPESVLWCTIEDGDVWWCFAEAKVIDLYSGDNAVEEVQGARMRRVIDRSLAARSVSRQKNDPGAHFRELFGSDLSDAGGASRNDNRLPLHETLPRHMALYRSVRVRPASDLATTRDRMAKAD